MATITQNGIPFNNVKTAGVEKEAWPLILADQQGPDSEGGIINAVDIDWNGAQIRSSYTGNLEREINTTGDLIQYISQKVNTNDFINILNSYMEYIGQPSNIRYENGKIVIE